MTPHNSKEHTKGIYIYIYMYSLYKMSFYQNLSDIVVSYFSVSVCGMYICIFVCHVLTVVDVTSVSTVQRTVLGKRLGVYSCALQFFYIVCVTSCDSEHN